MLAATDVTYMPPCHKSKAALKRCWKQLPQAAAVALCVQPCAGIPAAVELLCFSAEVGFGCAVM
jgi:hypothetical protein